MCLYCLFSATYRFQAADQAVRDGFGRGKFRLIQHPSCSSLVQLSEDGPNTLYAYRLLEIIQPIAKFSCHEFQTYSYNYLYSVTK